MGITFSGRGLVGSRRVGAVSGARDKGQGIGDKAWGYWTMRVRGTEWVRPAAVALTVRE